MMSTKYMCFSYDTYYPQGGMSDCRLITEDLNEAEDWLRQQNTTCGNAYIYVTNTEQQIYKDDLWKQ